MKETLTTSQAADQLRADKYANWSYAGALAMIEYLERLEEDLGEEIEMDVTAIRCDFTEYASLDDYAQEIDFEYDSEDEEEREDEVRKYLSERTTLIEFEGGIIVAAF